MILKLLLGALFTWRVVGCAMEEPDTSGALAVDPNSEIEVPEGLTAKDVDHNNDGVVNILDLVIVSKLFGEVDIVDKSPNDTDDYTKLPILPEVIYAKFELEQYAYDLSQGRFINNTDYAEKIQVATRIQVKKSDRDKILKDLTEYGITRSPGTAGYVDDLDSYHFPKIVVKIIDDQGTKKLPQILTALPIVWNGIIQLPRRSLSGMCDLTTGFLADTDVTDIKFFSRNYPKMSGEGMSYGIPITVYYSHNIRNINDYKECDNLDTYHIVKNSLHIGKKLSNNLDNEKYTNAFIRSFKLRFKIPPSKDNMFDHIDYRFLTQGNPYHFDKEPKGRLLMSQFINPSTQQQIKAEHFPEDIE